ncbi:hypothetical protein E1J24_01360 [Xanthomonas hortorum pv. pelargonii]|uniref:RelA/SpoT domain-containing protein n=1 Tax=Xanthomonas hortorum pv. pelargonii TaxID=453602 RepID=A0AAW9ZL58_9XANT|nr:hypothetical protein [Xanthomonas hortorum pv. pelargonii]
MGKARQLREEGLHPAQAPGRGSGPPAPGKDRRQADHPDQGPGRLSRRGCGGSVQAGSLPLLSFSRGTEETLPPTAPWRIALLSNSQVTRLGERLRDGVDDATALSELEVHRSGFIPAYNHVLRILKEKLFLSATGRFKSTISIVEKLRRGSSRLSQIQDIAGCRVITRSLAEQLQVVDGLTQWFDNTRVVERTIETSNGYRATHVLIRTEGKTVEVQVRTLIQNYWASISERMADLHGQEVKYGGGPNHLLRHLLELAASLESTELANERYARAKLELSRAKRKRVSNEEWASIRKEEQQAKRIFEAAMSRARVLINSEILRGI